MEGHFKAHSIALFVLWCVIILGLNAFSIMCLKHWWPLSFGFFIVVILMIKAGSLIRKKDYSWFLYIPYVGTGLILSLLSILAGVRSLEVSTLYYLVTMAVFVGGAVSFSRILFKSLMKQIETKTTKDTSSGYGGISTMLGLIAATFSMVIAERMSSPTQALFFAIALAFVQGCNIYFITPYVLGKQYDPSGELIAKIRQKNG